MPVRVPKDLKRCMSAMAVVHARRSMVAAAKGSYSRMQAAEEYLRFEEAIAREHRQMELLELIQKKFKAVSDLPAHLDIAKAKPKPVLLPLAAVIRPSVKDEEHDDRMVSTRRALRYERAQKIAERNGSADGLVNPQALDVFAKHNDVFVARAWITHNLGQYLPSYECEGRIVRGDFVDYDETILNKELDRVERDPNWRVHTAEGPASLESSRALAGLVGSKILPLLSVNA